MYHLQEEYVNIIIPISPSDGTTKVERCEEMCQISTVKSVKCELVNMLMYCIELKCTCMCSNVSVSHNNVLSADWLIDWLIDWFKANYKIASHST